MAVKAVRLKDGEAPWGSSERKKSVRLAIEVRVPCGTVPLPERCDAPLEG